MSLLERAPAIISRVSGQLTKGKAALTALKATRGGKMALAGAGAVGVSAAGSYIANQVGEGGDEAPRRRRSRGISAREFRTTQRTMRKIIKMFNKLPKRPSKSSKACSCKGACKC
jgi:hypothetical protein